jgi:hypothetical protein
MSLHLKLRTTGTAKQSCGFSRSIVAAAGSWRPTQDRAHPTSPRATAQSGRQGPHHLAASRKRMELRAENITPVPIDRNAPALACGFAAASPASARKRILRRGVPEKTTGKLSKHRARRRTTAKCICHSAAESERAGTRR